MSVSRRLVVALASIATVATAAQAQTRTWNVCGGNTFNTCASVHLTVTGQNVTVHIWNLSGFHDTYAGTVFTAVGFEGIGAGVSLASNPTPTMSGPVRPGDAPSRWGIRDDRQVGGGVNLDLVGTSNPNNTNVDNSIANACAAAGQLPGGENDLWMNPCSEPTSPTGGAGWVTITFSVTGTWDLENTYLLVKGQNGPGGASTQCITGGSQENCMNIVPEPITMVLLGSGLVGVGGANFFRRRRKDETPA